MPKDNKGENQPVAETVDTADKQVDKFLDKVMGGDDGTPDASGSDTIVEDSQTPVEEVTEKVEAGAEEKFKIEIESATGGDEVQVGDVIKRDGKAMGDQEITLDDGSKVRTDADGKITEVIPATDAEDSNPNILKIKTTDANETEPKVEKFDLSKPEEKAKVIEYAQKGRYLERERESFNTERKTFEAEKTDLGTTSTTLAFNTMYLQSMGKLNESAFTELPYEDFVGKSARLDKDGNEIAPATEAGDRKLWNDHNNGVRTNLAQLKDYQDNYRRTSSQFLKLTEDFVKKHPEIKDVKKWVQENIGPYHAPVMTYGKVQYPEDILEMVYFWKNRDKIINNAREDERRKIAKGKVIKDNTNSNRVSTDKVNKVDGFLNKEVFRTNRTIVH